MSSLATDNLASLVFAETSLVTVADVHTGPVKRGLRRLEFRVAGLITALRFIRLGDFDGVCCHIVITEYNCFKKCQA